MFQSSFVQTLIVSLVTLMSLVLMSVMLAYWSWMWFAPATESPAMLHSNARMENAYSLFGSTPKNQSGVALTGTLQTGMAIRLLGIVAGSNGHHGYAVVQVDAKDIHATQEGEEIAPGIRLTEVSTDHLVLERNGIRESLAWPEKRPVDKNNFSRTGVAEREN